MKTKNKLNITGNFFNLFNISIILCVSIMLFVSGCIEEKGTAPAKPTNCSAISHNFAGCDISCDMDSDCKMECCGCINKDENCQTELNGETVSCENTGDCECKGGKCDIKPPFDPDDIGSPSEIVASGPVDEKTVIDLAGEDKVAFFFLHNPGCGHCSSAEKHLPEIQEMFGQRMIIYKLKIRDSESQPWRNKALGAGLSTFPFTLAVGAHAVDGNNTDDSKIGMTSSSGSEKYEAWKRNICLQFEKPPSNCSEYLN